MNKGIIIIFLTIFLALISVVFLFIEPKKKSITDKNLLYHDKHVEIYNDFLILSGFYFGPIGRKKILFEDISSIEIVDLSWKTGKYRFQGTGDFRTWYTQDVNRSSKEKGFIIIRPAKWWKIAFTVENFEKVFSIFYEKGLIKNEREGKK